MANIDNELNQIKHAVFGKEVRGSIHDGIDSINKESEITKGKQEMLESTFDQLIINAGTSNAEVVAARVEQNGTSHDTLGKRLNNFDSSLDTIENKLDTLFINVQDFKHLVIDGDWTNAIKSCFNNNIQKRQVVFFPSGEYKISDTIEINVSWVSFKGESSIINYYGVSECALKLTSNVPMYGQPFYQSTNSIEGLMIINKLSNLELNTYSSIGILCEGKSKTNSVSHISIDRMCIVGFNKGIEFRSYSYLISINETDIHENDFGVYMGSGFTDYGENIRLNDCTIYHNKMGIYNNNGSGDIVLIGTSIDYNRASIDNGETQQSRIRCVNCHLESSNTADYNIIKNSNGFVTFVNSMIFITINYIPNSNNKRLFYSKYMSGGIYFDSCFIDIVENNKENITLNYDTNPSFTDGGGIVKSINGKSYNTPNSMRLLGESNIGINNKDFIKLKTDNIEVLKETGINKETGAYSIRLKKNANGEANVIFCIPLSQTNTYPFTMFSRIKTDFNSEDYINMSMYVANIDFAGNIIGKSSEQTITRKFNEILNFSTFRINITKQNANAGVGTHLCIQINLNSLNANNNVWVDRIICDSY